MKLRTQGKSEALIVATAPGPSASQDPALASPHTHTHTHTHTAQEHWRPYPYLCRHAQVISGIRAEPGQVCKALNVQGRVCLWKGRKRHQGIDRKEERKFWRSSSHSGTEADTLD